MNRYTAQHYGVIIRSNYLAKYLVVAIVLILNKMYLPCNQVMEQPVTTVCNYVDVNRQLLLHICNRPSLLHSYLYT